MNAKKLRLQTEYMGTRRTKVTIHGVSCKDRMGAFFSKYGQVNEVKVLISKSGIATGDMELQVTVNRKSFGEIPNILVCQEKRMLVEGWRPCCWLCGASGHMAKECPH